MIVRIRDKRGSPVGEHWYYNVAVVAETGGHPNYRSLLHNGYPHLTYHYRVDVLICQDSADVTRHLREEMQ